jgi:RNA recognition motif-containing protein
MGEAGQGCIIVKNLDASIDNQALYDTFSLFGNILSCKVECGIDGKSTGSGIVHFEEKDSAKQAIDSVNDMKIGENTVTVEQYTGDPSDEDDQQAARVAAVEKEGACFDPNLLSLTETSEFIDRGCDDTYTRYTQTLTYGGLTLFKKTDSGDCTLSSDKLTLNVRQNGVGTHSFADGSVRVDKQTTYTYSTLALYRKSVPDKKDVHK